MRIPDGLIVKYLRLSAPLDPVEVDSIERGLGEGDVHPNEAKRRLAREVVDLYHGAGAGAAAEVRFNVVHREHDIPDEVPSVSVPSSVFGEQDGVRVVYVPALLEAMGLVGSRSEARRLQAQGGVRVDGEQVPQEDIRIEGDPPGQLAGSVWQVGRRKFARLAGIDEER
jgi:tyrosyl-tRNA synthetase